MRQLIKKMMINTPLYDWQIRIVAACRKRKEVFDWKRKGMPAPPPHLIKQKILKEYARKYGLKVLVETGTYYGDMVHAMRNEFDLIYSIELSRDLHEKAKTRFEGLKHIVLIQGDSGQELAKVIRQLDQPALFWLDGHYSAGVTAKGNKTTPIFEELDHIMNSAVRSHVLIIDDARCFGHHPEYPNMNELMDYIHLKAPDAHIEVKDDSIRIVPTLALPHER
jgi:hypothetical protein